MAFIGYSNAGYNELSAEIKTRKANLLAELDKLPEVKAAIEDSWKGADASDYCTNLSKLINDTRTAVSDIYDEMGRQFEKTHNDWVNKQNNRGETE